MLRTLQLDNQDTKKDKDVIVYVMSRYIHEDKSDYVLDFRLEDDYYQFQEEIGEQIIDFPYSNERNATVSVRPSLLFLKNVPSRLNGSHFREDSYYRLNLQSLFNAEISLPRGENLFLAVYDFNGVEINEEEEMPLLQKTRPLIPDELKVYPNDMSFYFPPDKTPQKITVRIRNVGQGNWNEILFDDKYSIIYDIGTNLHATLIAMRKLVMDRYSEYKTSKPLLLISHWDADHINCLSVFSINELKECFDGVCCMNKMRSMLSLGIYRNLQSAFGRSVYCYTPCAKTITDSQRRVQLNNHVSFYIGRQSRSINYSGLSLVVRNSLGSALLTGDLRLEQAYDIYTHERGIGLSWRNHMLTAPHHGGRYSYGRKVYANFTSKVVISVGRNNQYGHPEDRMLQLYENISNYNVHRTDLHGDCDFQI